MILILSLKRAQPSGPMQGLCGARQAKPTVPYHYNAAGYGGSESLERHHNGASHTNAKINRHVRCTSALYALGGNCTNCTVVLVA